VRKYVSLTIEASIFDFGFPVVKSSKRINVHYVHLCIYVCRYCESSAPMTALRLICVYILRKERDGEEEDRSRSFKFKGNSFRWNLNYLVNTNS
jgi:hypothetical protein